jgi:hypothetical protein
MQPAFDYDVFLSFARGDEEIARPLWQQLCLSGLRVFWSDASLKLRLGESWFDSIQSALERSRHFVLVATSTSMSSEWVRREYKAFYTHCHAPGRRLIPVLADSTSTANLPLLLRDLEASRLGEAAALRGLIQLLGGADMDLLRTQLAQAETERDLLRQRVGELASQLEGTARAGDSADAADAVARGSRQPKDAQPTVAIDRLPPASKSTAQLRQLEASHPTARPAIERFVQEVSITGGMDLDDANSVSVWRRMHNEFAGREIPELIHILNAARDWSIKTKALTLLNYSAGTPVAQVWQSVILDAVADHLCTGGHVQNVALKLLSRLRVDRVEVWRCLFQALPLAQASHVAGGLAKMIGRFTLPEERERTGAILLDLLFFFDDSSNDVLIANAIAAMNYRAAIPTLRAALARYVLQQEQYKVTCSCDLLLKWGDKEAAFHMRQYVDAMYRETISTTYLHVLKTLYQLEGKPSAAYIGDRLLNSSPENQRRMAYVHWADFRDEIEVVSAVRLMGERSSQVSVKKNVEAFLNALKR